MQECKKKQNKTKQADLDPGHLLQSYHPDQFLDLQISKTVTPKLSPWNSNFQMES